MIIDTNVLHVAQRTATHAPSHCVIRCLDAIEQSLAEVVALDSSGEILDEYARNVAGGYPLGPAAAFVRELFHVQFDTTRCELVTIHEHFERGYEEFPDDPDLVEFDRSDRKFVAVAIAASIAHRVYNAVDTDWADADEALRKNGVLVNYLCPSFSSPTPSPVAADASPPRLPRRSMKRAPRSG